MVWVTVPCRWGDADCERDVEVEIDGGPVAQVIAPCGHPQDESLVRNDAHEELLARDEAARDLAINLRIDEARDRALGIR